MLGNIVVVAGGLALTVFLWLMHLQTHALEETGRSLERQLTVFRFLLEEHGEFRVSNGTMRTGDYVINGNYEIPDLMRKTFGGTATVFLGDVRISTSVLNRDGSRAVGTHLEGPVFKAVMKHGRSFRGEASIQGTRYLTAYDPIRTREGEVIGALYVGVRKDDILGSHAESLAGAGIVGVLMIVGCTFLSAALVRRIRNSEEHYRTIFETTGTATVIVEDGVVRQANSRFVTLSGVDCQELENGVPWADFLRFPDLARVLGYHRARMIDPESAPQSYEFRFFPRSGAPQDVLCHVGILPGSSRCVISLTDLTERKRTYGLLDAEKQTLERIAAGSSLEETLALLCTRIEELSEEGACSILLLGRETKRLRHCAAPSLPDAYNTAVGPVPVGEGIGSCGTAAFRKEQVIVTDIASDPLWKNFRDLPLRHGLRGCWSTPILSPTGELYGTFAVYYRSPRGPRPFELQSVAHAVDLARIAIERERGESLLRQSEERFRQIFRQNEDAVLLLDLKSFDLIDANPQAERLYGLGVEELRRLSPRGLISPADLPTVRQAISRLEGDGGFHLERLSQRGRDGAPVTVSVWAKIIQLHDEQVLYCSIRDITEKVRMEDEVKQSQAWLIHANKMASLGMLVSGIAHEINNPNNFIRVNSGLLAEAWADAIPVLDRFHRENGPLRLAGLPWPEAGETIPRLLQGVGRGSERIAAIVKNLRELVSGDASGSFHPVDLADVVSDATLILTHLIHRHTDHFQVEIPAGLPPAMGNFQQIEQVFINLLANALQSLPAKSAGVRVSAWSEPQNGTLVLQVRDEGKGMSRSVLEKSTEPFFSTRLDEGGTGLGLFISKSIVRAHGGSLDLESKPGEGTSVTLRLPAAPNQTTPTAERTGLLS